MTERESNAPAPEFRSLSQHERRKRPNRRNRARWRGGARVARGKRPQETQPDDIDSPVRARATREIRSVRQARLYKRDPVRPDVLDECWRSLAGRAARVTPSRGSSS